MKNCIHGRRIRATTRDRLITRVHQCSANLPCALTLPFIEAVLKGGQTHCPLLGSFTTACSSISFAHYAARGRPPASQPSFTLKAVYAISDIEESYHNSGSGYSNMVAAGERDPGSDGEGCSGLSMGELT